MTNSQFRSEVSADIARQIQEIKSGRCCDRCGETNLIDGWVLRFGSLFCLTCRMEQNYAAKMEEADDRKQEEGL